MMKGIGKIPFWGDFSKFDRWSFYVDYYNLIDRYDFLIFITLYDGFCCLKIGLIILLSVKLFLKG